MDLNTLQQKNLTLKYKVVCYLLMAVSSVYLSTYLVQVNGLEKNPEILEREDNKGLKLFNTGYYFTSTKNMERLHSSVLDIV